MTLTAIVCCFPQHTSEIIFAGGRESLFRASLQSMIRQGAYDNVIIATSNALNEASRKELARLGFEVHYSEHTSPQKRIFEVMETHDLKQACVLNGYSFLPEPETTTILRKALEAGHPLAAAGLESPFRYQCLLTHDTARHLAENVHVNINPLQLHATNLPNGEAPYLAAATDDTVSVDGILWLMLTHAMQTGDQKQIDALAQKVAGADTPLAGMAYEMAGWGLDFLSPTTDWDHTEVFKICSLMQEYMTVWRPKLAPLSTGRFLEIGYGDSPHSAFLYSMDFVSGTAIEPFSYDGHPDFCRNTATLNQVLPQLSSLLPGFDLPTALPESVEFIPKHLDQCGFDKESVDFCYSVTVLEHVDDLQSLMQGIHRVLRTGGSMMHCVDYSGHGYCDGNPYPFYAQSRKDWLSETRYLNLLRHSEVVQIMEESGFTVSIIRQEKNTAMPDSLDEDWEKSTQEDLETCKAIYWCMKK